MTDSLGRPVTGARVRVGGTSFEAVTAVDGTYRFADLGRGTWTVTASHPGLAEMGHDGTSAVVQLEPGDTRRVRLDLPSVREIALERCADTPPAAGEAVLVGRVLDEQGAPVAGAQVRTRWAEYIVRPSAIVVRTHGVGSQTDGAGRYLVCNLPTDRTVRLTAVEGGRGAEIAELRVPRDAAVMAADLRLLPDRITRAAAGVNEPTARREGASAQISLEDSLWLASKGFWIRQREALLHLTGRAIEETRLGTFTQIVGRLPRVQIVLLSTGRRELRLHATEDWRAGADPGSGCLPEFYLNGWHMRPGVVREDSSRRIGTPERSAAARGLAGMSDIDELIDVPKLTALEVFDAADAPVGTPDGCGAILLWIRSMTSDDDPDFTGSLRGEIICASAEPLPGARVRLKPGRLERVTDKEGRFEFGRLQPARYRIHADIPEWGPWSTEILLRAGTDASSRMEIHHPGCGGRPGDGSRGRIHP